MAEERKKENIIESINKSILDLSEKVFGKSGREFVEKTQQQLKEFNSTVVKSFVDFTDKFLESTKLKENELVKKSVDSVKDLLKQVDLLEEESEDDF